MTSFNEVDHLKHDLDINQFTLHKIINYYYQVQCQLGLSGMVGEYSLIITLPLANSCYYFIMYRLFGI